jgi:hypothetical protein
VFEAVKQASGRPVMKASEYIDEYASMLQTRRKWALRYLTTIGVVFALSAAVSLGLAWAFRGELMSPLFTLYIALLLISPLFGLVIQAVEYRRLKDTLELLDVVRDAVSRVSANPLSSDSSHRGRNPASFEAGETVD